MLNNTPTKGKNIILSGHGGTLKFDGDYIFEKDETQGGIDERKETGFIVIENLNGKLYARYKFESIKDFVNATLLLPVQ
jgi:hypothetical protein